MLRFNISGFQNEFLRILNQEIDIAIDAWEQEIYSNVNKGWYSFEGARAKVAKEGKMEGRRIVKYLKANPYVFMSSYGTGSLMLDDNPFLAEYKSSELWNPLRTGKAIVGRRKGTYKTIFGTKRTTSGAFAGVNIEGKRVFKGKRRQLEGETTEDYYIYPHPPTYAIQLAQEILLKQWLPIAYKNTVNRINLSKFLVERKDGS